MNIDAKNLIVGRVASVAAKKALQGEKVDIYNTELAVISSGKFAAKKYAARVERGLDPTHGPFYPRTPIGIMKRTIRGMLPYKQERGMNAYKRVKCYMGVKKDIKLETIKGAHIEKLPKYNFVILKDLSKKLGWKK